MQKVKFFSWNKETIQFHYVLTTKKLHFKGFGQHGNVETALDDSPLDIGEVGTTPLLNLLAKETNSEEEGIPE